MKKQIKRLSPHQNAKVFGLLFAIATLPFLIPMMLMMQMSMPHNSGTGFSPLMMIMMPLMYLIFGYLLMLFGCLVYNFIQGHVGGFEFEVSEIEDTKNN
jgi:Ca2+/H+ antiporter